MTETGATANRESPGLLLIIFGSILILMLGATTWASLDRGVLTAAAELLADRWFVATLLDAYCGFLTFYCWVCWKRRRTRHRACWFAAIMLLGNIAMAAFMVAELRRIRREFSWERLLVERLA